MSSEPNFKFKLMASLKVPSLTSFARMPETSLRKVALNSESLPSDTTSRLKAQQELPSIPHTKDTPQWMKPNY